MSHQEPSFPSLSQAMADTQVAPMRQRREAVVYFDAGSHPTSPKSPGSFPSRTESEIDGCFHDVLASALEPLPDDRSTPACLSPARPRREATTLENSGSGAFPAATLVSASSTGSHGSEPVRRRRAAEPLDSVGSGTISADLHADEDSDTAVVARPSVIIHDEMELFAMSVQGAECDVVPSTGSLVIVCKEDAE